MRKRQCRTARGGPFGRSMRNPRRSAGGRTTVGVARVGNKAGSPQIAGIDTCVSCWTDASPCRQCAWQSGSRLRSAGAMSHPGMSIAWTASALSVPAQAKADIASCAKTRLARTKTVVTVRESDRFTRLVNHTQAARD
jgi:hypothetical protein